jgi:hypothetical protein
MTNRSEDEPADLSSAACSMPEADDAYMGYAGKAELAAFLNELLAGERAGSTGHAQERARSRRRPYRQVAVDHSAGRR